MKLFCIIPVINCLELTKAAIDSIHSPCTIILIDNNSDDGTREWGERMDGQVMTHGKKLKYIRNDVRLSVAASWNQGIKLAFEDAECEYVAVLNNDIILHPKTLEHLMAYMDKTGYLMVTGDNIKDRMSPETMIQMELPVPYTDFDLWPIEGWRSEGPDFSCFLINRETIRIIGWFDEKFEGAYCEDWDYHKRIQTAREHIEKHNDQNIKSSMAHAKRLSTAPYYHFASQTIIRNVELRTAISASHGRNQNYYLEKWGGDHPEVMDGGGNKTPFGRADMDWTDW